MQPRRTAKQWKKAVSRRDSNACSTASQSALNAAISRAAAHRVGGPPGSKGFMSIDPDAPDHRVSGLRSYHAHPEITGSLGEFEMRPDRVPAVDSCHQFAWITLKTMPVHGFD